MALRTSASRTVADSSTFDRPASTRSRMTSLGVTPPRAASAMRRSVNSRGNRTDCLTAAAPAPLRGWPTLFLPRMQSGQLRRQLAQGKMAAV
jgi:hypothetical protein